MKLHLASCLLTLSGPHSIFSCYCSITSRDALKQAQSLWGSWITTEHIQTTAACKTPSLSSTRPLHCILQVTVEKSGVSQSHVEDCIEPVRRINMDFSLLSLLPHVLACQVAAILSHCKSACLKTCMQRSNIVWLFITMNWHHHRLHWSGCLQTAIQ